LLSLNKKIGLNFLLAFFIFNLLFYFIFSFFLEQKLKKEEEKNVLAKQARVNASLAQDLEQVACFAQFLINSKQAHFLLTLPGQKFSTQATNILKSVHMHGLAFLNEQGEVVKSVVLSSKNRLLSYLQKHGRVLLARKKEVSKGFCARECGGGEVVVVPLVGETNKYHLILFRSFSEEKIKQLINITGVEFSYLAKEEVKNKSFFSKLTDKGKYLELNDKYFYFYWLKEDILGNKSLVFSLKDLNEDIIQAKEILYKLFVVILSINCVLLFFLSSKIKNIVFNFLNKINSELSTINSLQDLKRRLNVSRYEQELIPLINNINKMIGRLEDNSLGFMENLKLYSAIVNQSTDIIFLYDLETKKIIKYNNAFKNYFGYTDEEIQRLTVYDLVDNTREEVDAILATFKKEKNLLGERPYKNKEGKVFYVDVSAYVIELAGKKIVSILAKDITAKKLRQEKLTYLAFHDALTGLPNRLYFLRQGKNILQQAEDREEVVALIYLDLDDFKLINDVYGHQAGDFVLENLAKRLKKTLRRGDLVARLGGDEFVLMAPGLKKDEDVKVVINKIAMELEEPIYWQQDEIKLSVSMGISLFPEQGKDLATLLEKADQAMYAAKKNSERIYYLFEEDKKSG
jgi:diguanylate cyclase (GGDEF)-like protein/PAS domain S-box-containing protein